MTLEWRLPLSRAVLSDPAFSSDPRSHPHFPLPFTPTRSLLLPPPPPPPPKAGSLRKAIKKAAVHHLTSRNNLDRIDELDETDPFGANYHHDGPYEAITTTRAHTAFSQSHIHAVPPKANIHHSEHELVPRSLHPVRPYSAPRLPIVDSEVGPSFQLQPGHIIQHDIIHTSYASNIPPAPNHPPPLNIVVMRSDHSRNHSLPNFRTHSLQDTTLHFLDHSHYRPSSFPHTPPKRYPGDHMSGAPSIHHDREPPPYVLTRAGTTDFPSPRSGSRLCNSDRLPPARIAQLTESARPVPHNSKHESIHSLDSSHTINNITMQSTSSMQNKSPELSRIRHYPKRLVMPAPLQPQTPYKHPVTEPVVWQDDPERHALECTNFEGQPVMHPQGPRLLRKKPTVSPENLPISHHVPIPQDDAELIMETAPSKTANDGEATKEKSRRRKLSKRKNNL